jgi:hypothetical protein
MDTPVSRKRLRLVLDRIADAKKRGETKMTHSMGDMDDYVLHALNQSGYTTVWELHPAYNVSLWVISWSEDMHQTVGSKRLALVLNDIWDKKSRGDWDYNIPSMCYYDYVHNALVALGYRVEMKPDAVYGVTICSVSWRDE